MREGVSVIIPAYNEANRIPRVLSIVLEARTEGIVDDIFVVDDGSTDETLACIKQFSDVTYIALPKNQGKGMAMLEGSRAARGDVLLFLDADLNGLTVQHVADLVDPVRYGKVDVTISLRDPTPLTWVYNILGINPVSGERAMLKSFFIEIPIDVDTGYTIETRMNALLLKKNMSFLPVRTYGLKNCFKHTKSGLNGLISDVRMYRQILAANPLHLYHFLKMVVRSRLG